MEPPAVFGPSPDCPAGSGKPKGRLCPYKEAKCSKQNAASVEARDFTARASRSKRDFLHNGSSKYFEGTTGSIYSRRIKTATGTRADLAERWPLGAHSRNFKGTLANSSLAARTAETNAYVDPAAAKLVQDSSIRPLTAGLPGTKG